MSVPPPAPFSHAIGRSRFIVLLAVAAVLVVAVSLFLLGTLQAGIGVYRAWSEVLKGHFNSTELTVQSLEVVSVMLKAVVFYIIGVGLYSLFIAPLNLTVSLGVESLADLENKVVSVIIVILGVTYLEHFIEWGNPLETLEFGVSLSVVVAALVAFQRYSSSGKGESAALPPEAKTQAKVELFENDNETHLTSAAPVAASEPAPQAET